MSSNRIKNKLLFCTEDIWRKVFLCQRSSVFKAREKLIYHRSSVIPKIFLNYEISIYCGNKWTKRNVNRWMVGFRFGEFTWNKKVAVYKAKQLKKKNNYVKFEQLLKIYWSKGFYFAGKMRSFNLTIDELFFELEGLNSKSKFFFIKRFEFGYYKYKDNKSLILLPLDYRKVINMYLSQMTSVSNNVSELWKINLVRLYLIKSFRGKAQAMGKPARGQRTWSNAWTAYKLSTPLKTFVNEMKKTHARKIKPESKNKKMIKKKIKISYRVKIKTEKKKNNIWF